MRIYSCEVLGIISTQTTFTINIMSLLSSCLCNSVYKLVESYFKSPSGALNGFEALGGPLLVPPLLTPTASGIRNKDNTKCCKCPQHTSATQWKGGRDQVSECLAEEQETELGECKHWPSWAAASMKSYLL